MLSSMQRGKMYNMEESMVEWQITDQDIESTEKLLLPNGAHFSDDAIKVIRCWYSTDVAACPGSGKTTVLLAKLKLLADRMPFADGAGICVLSHTNVAVNEIKKRLSSYEDKLLSYPNYVGTIQSFVDKFVTIPYLKYIYGRNIQTVDTLIYSQHMMSKMKTNKDKYRALDYVIKNNLQTSKQFTSPIDFIKALYIREDDSLCVGNQKKALAGAQKDSTNQFKELRDDLIKDEGLIRYQDAYLYANEAISKLPEKYTALFSSRFKYVFIDEYQDCDENQRQALDMIFDSKKCTVIRIGDSDQAIYNSSEDKTSDWVPQHDFLSITTSCRYSQEIADVIGKLKKDENGILTLVGYTGIKPTLLVFEPDKIDRVIDGFINALDSCGLNDENGIYKAIGAVRSENTTGLKIGSYWSGFDSSVIKQSDYNYWAYVDNIVTSLLEGKLYKAEKIVRKLLCQIFRYMKISNSKSGKEFTVATIKKMLEDEYRELYRQWIYELSIFQNVNRASINCFMRQKINELLIKIAPQLNNIVNQLPDYFFNDASKNQLESQTEKREKNVYIDLSKGRRIIFDTIHGVKGETHDATLYLETDRKKASDINRILPCYGVGKPGCSPLYDYSRKLAYVGMSRPKKLLCVAIQAKTYEASKGVFDNSWNVVHLT